MIRRVVFPALLLCAALSTMTETRADDVRVYIGTYTGGDSEGIYLATLDRDAGTLSEPQLAAKVDNPSFLALHPTRPLLYSVSVGRKPQGAVTAFAVDAQTGLLKELNKQSTGGAGPCHVSVDPTGHVVAAANYGGGSICSFLIADDGSLNEATSFIQHDGSSTDPDRQQGPHAHSVNFDLAGRYLVACDLGLDKLLVYQINGDTAALTANNPPSTSVAGGSGPRHLAFHPSGKFAFACLEMSSEVRAFLYDPPTGVFYGLSTYSTLPEGADAKKLDNSTAETQVHPNGKFVYVSNRGHNSIAIFTIDEQTGALTATGHVSSEGETPRNFGIDPSGQFLLASNQSTDNIVVFRIDPETGGLTATGSSIKVPSPVCVRMAK